jgi:hypothetical protein
MVLIWQRSGIAIPIVFFICGWIVSNWFEDTRLGNTSFMGWTLFYTAIVTSVHALVVAGAKEEGDNGGRHSFFWIPVGFWPFILGGLSWYLITR